MTARAGAMASTNNCLATSMPGRPAGAAATTGAAATGAGAAAAGSLSSRTFALSHAPWFVMDEKPARNWSTHVSAEASGNRTKSR